MLPSGTSRRDKAAVRERLEASVSGLGELELLRRRQEVLVRAALGLREEEEEEERRRREAQLSSEEKLLEGNILLLRKQLVGPHLCLSVTSDLCEPGSGCREWSA